ncbi:MAG TPA: glutamate-1-semialdehyde 2,1-aminomutase [Bacteroidota bacterium]|nr:glutamate-1-semialdehyde 2,1-aminomutase [Bacteroidota bacterium]
MKTRKSLTLFRRAERVIPGGVNSPVRAFRAVGGNPVFIAGAKGSILRDADGNAYTDFIGSWGPMLFGHAHPRIVKAIRRAAAAGTSFGAPTEAEVRMAEAIVRMVPSVEKVRMVNSGTEATMSALRLARAFTGREGVIKFEGCYHGHADSFLIGAGSGALTLGIPDSPGVPRGLAKQTFTCRYNDIESVRKAAERHRGAIAAVIVEPVAGNMGCVPPGKTFLRDLRSLCDRHGMLLIFDEVMTGFRLAPGGAQEKYGIRPDLTTLGKIIGGGLPVGAYGGKKAIMKMVAPEGPVYQAGTLSGNPLAMAAGLEMLAMISENRRIYADLEAAGRALGEGLSEPMVRRGIPHTLNRVGSMFTIFFTAGPVTDFTTAKTCDTKLFGRYFRSMLARGVCLPPSQFEAAFISAAHTERDIDCTLRAHRAALAGL